MSILAKLRPRRALLALVAPAATVAFLATAAPASAADNPRLECYPRGAGYDCIWIPSDLDPGANRDLDVG
jgi:hypothetical protein